MTEATAAAVSKVASTSPPPDDLTFDFTIEEWIAASLIVRHKDESTAAVKRRHQAEHVYRSKTNPTHWHRYLTLGRYAMSGPDFDNLMNDQDVDELKIHCVIWYNFAFHVDRHMECSPKLEAWAVRKSKPFLEKHQSSALLVDTLSISWTKYAKQQSLSENWSKVSNKKSSKVSKKQALLTPFMSAAKVGTNSKPSTIVEENSKESSSATTSNKDDSKVCDDASESSDGKMSALMPSLNVPVCDGTYRVTVRWKLSMELNRISRQASEMKEAIYTMLIELFTDDDGHLYKWSDDGTTNFKAISKMTSTEVRQFICPSLTIIPSQSLAIIPLRYGFSGTTPSNWRNSAATRTTLEKYNATVSISNSTSTSGDLVISGYLLLKAPMTTHRLRYLQSLRKQLPDETPPFDILLHKRSPTDDFIPHLVVQCGEKHVHPLCESLMSILTGDNSPIFIPRSALVQMPTDEVTALFQTHDSYVKSIQWLPLSPLLTNLDKPRAEHYPDGSFVERTTREWARSIKTLDGKEFANCDVVNGGSDQLAYLLFPPKSFDAANAALAQYRKRINPFQQREKKYRDKVGPATGDQFSRKVIANLDFMKKLSSDMKSVQSTSSSNQDKVTTAFDSSQSTASSVSVPSQVSSSTTSNEPGTPQAEGTRSDSETVDTDMTDTSRSTTQSKLGSDRMSTTSARFREIDKILSNQKQLHAKQEQMSSDRISQIERQLHRITTMEEKLDSVQQDFSTRLDDFEGKVLSSMKRQIDSSGNALESMNAKLEKLMLVVEKVVTDNAPQVEIATECVHDTTTSASERPAISRTLVSNLSDISMDDQGTNEASVTIKSPQKKRIRSATKRGRKRDLNEATRAALDSMRVKSTDTLASPPSDGNEALKGDNLTESPQTPISGLPRRHPDNTSLSISPTHDQTFIQIDDSVLPMSPPSPPLLHPSVSHYCDDDLLTPRISTPSSSAQATDPESQYTETYSSDDDKSLEDNDPSSHRRGATP